ncbi:hypothetical protein HispidOSU_025882, partial [Sigmodon hispidus]
PELLGADICKGPSLESAELMISPSSLAGIYRTSCSTIKPHFIMLGDKTFPKEVS